MTNNKDQPKVRPVLELFFAPALWLTSRLRFVVKSGLLLLIVVVAFGFVISSMYQQLNQVMSTARQELVGLDLMPSVFHVVEQIQEHRGLSFGVLNGGKTMNKARLMKQRRVSEAFSNLATKLSAQIIGGTDWQNINRAWSRIVKQGQTRSAADNFLRHQRLVEQLLRFAMTLADRFSLTSQSDIGIHYLLEALLDQLPSKLESLAQLRGVVTGMLAQKRGLTAAQSKQVYALEQQARSAMLSLQQDLGHASQLNPTIQNTLGAAAQRLFTQSRQVFTQLQTVVPGETSTMQPADFFGLATTALSTGYGIISRVLVPEIHKLISQQLQQAKNVRIKHLLFALLVLIVALYFAIGMYLSALHSIQYISHTAEQLARGDLSRRLQMGAKSELAGVAESINGLVDELTQLLRKEKESKERVQAIVDSSQDALVQLDANGLIIDWSHQAQNQLGWTRAQVLGQDSRQILIPDALRNQHQLRLSEFLSTGDAALLNQGIEAEILHQDGHSIAAEMSLAPIHTAHGYEFTVFIRDVSARKQSELRARTHRIVLEKLVNNEPLSYILVAIAHAVEMENPAALCSILLLDKQKQQLHLGAAPSLPDYFNNANDGFAIGENVGCSGATAFRAQRVIVEDLQHHPDWAVARELVLKAQLRSCWSEPIFGADARLLGTFAIYRRQQGGPNTADLALIEYASQLVALAIERHRINQRLLLSTRIFAETGEGILVTDASGTIQDVNPAFSNITGYSRSEIIGKNPNILKSGRQSDDFYISMWQRIRERGSWQGEIWNCRKDGEIYAEMLTISSILDEQGQISNYVGLFSDITLSKEQQKTMELMAHYDALTALPNRNLFSDRLNQAISRSKRKQTLLAVCFLDLDNFKTVNDHHGHDTGDRLLVEVAERIRANIREEDTACRQGGDEFILLLQELDTVDQCEQMLERICKTVARPYAINGHHHHISVSTGVTLYPLDDVDPDMLVRHADQAMYTAKQAGKNCFHLFDVAEDQKTLSRHQQLQELEHALQQGQFCLYYQPKVNMATGTIIGVEALIRWQHPQRGILAPDSFLPQLEGTALQIKIGDWVIEQALQHCARIRKDHSVYQVSINISSRHLQNENFTERLQQVLQQYPEVDPGTVQLEILESSALGDLQIITRVINRCRELCGVTIALDDFGTGYSSLTHMRNLPADTIKIDRSFVNRLLDDPDDYAIVDGVIALANSFNRQVLAEGVDTEEQGLMLLLMGCDLAQGYCIARPMPVMELARWVQHYQPEPAWLQLQAARFKEQENQLQQYALLLRHWLNRVTDNVQAAPEEDRQWPVLSGPDSPAGIWIQRARQGRHYSVARLDELQLCHQQMFDQAQKLYGKFLQGEVSAARESLVDLQTAVAAVLRLLQNSVGEDRQAPGDVPCPEVRQAPGI